MARNLIAKKAGETLATGTIDLAPSLHYLLLFFCSSAAAWLLYGLLSSTGMVAQQGFQLGGAAAGFVVIFWISHRILKSLYKQHTERLQCATIAEKDEIISQLEDTVCQLRTGELPPVICPEGFTPLVSRDNGLALAQPLAWEPHPEQTVVMLLRPMSEDQRALGFRGNINITSKPLDADWDKSIESPGVGADRQKSIDEALHFQLYAQLKVFHAEKPTLEPFYVGTQRGVRCRSLVPHPTIPERMNRIDCVLVVDEEHARLFSFSLVECKECAEESTEVFLKIVSSAIFLA